MTTDTTLAERSAPGCGGAREIGGVLVLATSGRHLGDGGACLVTMVRYGP
jgi:hypothetical protein